MPSVSPPHVILVTGLSGAGRSFTLKTLEDIGYESVDNLPLSLLRLIVSPGYNLVHPLAIGIDVRTRDFSVSSFLEQLTQLQLRSDLKIDVIFCECDEEVLARRYTETRRRHPLAEERPVMEGIKLERRLLTEIRNRATFVLDTSHLSINDTRHILRHQFPLRYPHQLFIQVISFAYRKGIPREGDYIFDCRFLKNPHYQKELANLTGQDEKVADYILQDEALPIFLESVKTLLTICLPRFDEEGRGYLTLAFGCTGGQHRSVFCAEQIYNHMLEIRRLTSLKHRDIPSLDSTISSP